MQVNCNAQFGEKMFEMFVLSVNKKMSHDCESAVCVIVVALVTW